MLLADVASVSVCRQLMLLIDLYSRVEVHDHILPIAFLLVDDCVYQVRVTALRVVRVILHFFH